MLSGALAVAPKVEAIAPFEVLDAAVVNRLFIFYIRYVWGELAAHKLVHI
jgi:hypothetical protein